MGGRRDRQVRLDTFNTQLNAVEAFGAAGGLSRRPPRSRSTPPGDGLRPTPTATSEATEHVGGFRFIRAEDGAAVPGWAEQISAAHRTCQSSFYSGSGRPSRAASTAATISSTISSTVISLVSTRRW